MVTWMHTDAIRIDWNVAIKEAEHAFDKLNNIEMAQVLCNIRDAYKKDDISGYLNILDEHRKELKS